MDFKVGDIVITVRGGKSHYDSLSGEVGVVVREEDKRTGESGLVNLYRDEPGYYRRIGSNDVVPCQGLLKDLYGK